MFDTPHGSVIVALAMIALAFVRHDDFSSYDWFWFAILQLNAVLQVRSWLKKRTISRPLR